MIPAERRRAVASFLKQIGRRGRVGAPDYFFQIVIVIIGVYLGITFEAKASDYDRTQKARATLRHLVSDMRRDDADMSRVLQAQQANARYYADVAAWLALPQPSHSARIDSLLWKVITLSPTVYPRRGVYSSMIAAGQLALLPEELSGQIVNLYENVYTRLAANGEHYDFVLERDFTPGYTRGWDPSRRDMINGDRSERTRFRNTALVMHAWSSYYSSLVSESQAQLRAVLADIDHR
jgi:hypothetical protein